MVRSMYFSKKKVYENPTKEPDAEQLMSTSGTYTSIESSKLVGNTNLDANVELLEDLGKHSTPRIDAALDVCLYHKENTYSKLHVHIWTYKHKFDVCFIGEKLWEIS